MRYLLKVDYYCPSLKTGGKWIEVDSDKSPKIGYTKIPYLPFHNCQKDIYSEDCKNNPDCQKQEILEFKCLDSYTYIIDESGFQSGCGFS